MLKILKTDDAADVGRHCFDRSGLGKAPYRVTQMVEGRGSCDYCGNGIVYQVHVASADGKFFKVGTDCMGRCGDAGLIKAFKKHPDFRRIQREKRQLLDSKKVAAWDALINASETIAKLQGVTVPGRPWVPGERVDALEDFKRRWQMSGMAGHARLLKELQHRIEK